MYENPYMGNPYMQNRYYGQQYQPVQQQTIQQPVAQLVGRPVDTQESIQASDVPMNMPYALFPKNDLSEIYLKSWNANGTIQTVVFKPMNNSMVNSMPNGENSNTGANTDATEEIMRRLDELSNQIQEIGNSMPKPRTVKAKKDGDSE